MTNVWVVDGLIGVGKSTLLNHLRRNAPFDDAHFVDEPVDLWQRSGLLQAMYAREMTPAVFQLMALATRGIRIQQALQSGGTFIMERSPWSDREVFASVNMAAESWERRAYDAIYDELQRSLKNVTLNVIFLDAPVSIVQDRIALRARGSESDISGCYLHRLKAAYDAYISGCECNTYTVDATGGADEVLAAVLNIMNQS